jgi:hypothetical protein
MKLFFLEDDDEMIGHSDDLFSLIREMGIEPIIVRNLADAENRLDVVPGTVGIDLYVFDISLPFEARLRGDELVEYGVRTGYAGFDFIVDYYTHDALFKEAVETGRVAINTGHDIEQYLREDMEPEWTVFNKVKRFSKMESDDMLLNNLKWFKTRHREE